MTSNRLFRGPHNFRPEAPCGGLLALFLLAALAVSACRSPNLNRPEAALPESSGYLLSGNNVADGFDHNALGIFDPAQGTLVRQVELPRSRANLLSRDSMGRLWIGLSGDMQQSDNRVLVYAADGTLLETLKLCRDPEAGITFAAGRVFIACTADGIQGELAVLDEATLQPITTLKLGIPNAPFLMTASGATAGRVVVVGMTTGPQFDLSYAAVMSVDPRTLAVEGPVGLGPATDVWALLPEGERFYLLNAASAHAPTPAERHDLFILEPGSPLTWTVRALPEPSPLWGVIQGSALYVYHNPGWNTTQLLPQRSVTRLDLATGETERWSLPDEFDSGGVAVLGDTLCLVHWAYQAPDSEHGLYCLDPGDPGEWKLKLPFPDASRVLVP